MPSSVHKWLPGFLIFQSIFWVISTFYPMGMTGLTTFFVSALSYLFVMLSIRYRKGFTICVLALILAVLLIYTADFLVSIFAEKTILMEDATQEISSSVEAPSGHEVGWLISLRDRVDYQHVLDYADWLLNRDDLPGNSMFEILFTTMVSIGLTLILYLIFQVRWFKIFLLSPLVYFIVMWYKYVDYAWPIYLLYFAGMFAMIAMDRHEAFRQMNDSHDHTHHATWKVHIYVLAISLLLIVTTNLIYFLVPFNAINTVVDAVVPNVWGARTAYNTDNLRIYSLWDTPYQNNPYELGGPVGPLNSEDPLLWVTLDKIPTAPLYLKTNVKSIYDGKNWMNPQQMFKNNFAYFLEDSQNIQMFEDNAFEAINGSIEMDLLKTITLIGPMGIYDSSLDGDRVYTSSENEGFYKSGLWVRNLSEYTFKATGKDLSYAQDADYLQLSDTIEDRTYDLALELGKMGETDYEKMIALTQFLAENYTYNLRIPTWRTTQDFVSRFLFETQTGYCTYFASSLTIMARINDIPARYVEGFRVDLPAFEKGNGRAKVTEADAHAWTEVYLDGLGWVIFESTPPYRQNLGEGYSPSLSDYIEEEETDEGSIDSQGSNTDGEVDESAYLMESDGGRADIETVYAGPQEEESSDLGLKIIASLLALLVFALMIFAFKVPYQFYKKSSPYAYTSRMLYYLTYLIRENRKETSFRTPEDIFKAVRATPEEIEIWYRLLYDRVERVDRNLVEQVRTSLEPYLENESIVYRRRKGRVAYWYLKLVKIPRLIQ